MPEIGIVPFFILFDHFCFIYVFPYCAFVLYLKLTTFDHILIMFPVVFFNCICI